MVLAVVWAGGHWPLDKHCRHPEHPLKNFVRCQHGGGIPLNSGARLPTNERDRGIAPQTQPIFRVKRTRTSVTRHPLLQHQLTKVGLAADVVSGAAWNALLDEVSHAYTAASLPAGGETAADAIAPPDEEQEKLAAVIGSLGEGLLVLDADLRVESINRQGERILQIPAGEMVGQPIDDLAATWSLRDRGPYAVSKMRHHLLRNLPYRNDDAFVVTEDGGIVHVSLVMTPIERGGELKGAVICFRDVTSLKVSENLLKESEERFRRIFKRAPTGMIRIAADGSIADTNQAFVSMLGRDGEDLTGLGLATLWHVDDSADAITAVAALFGGGTSSQAERRLVHRDGTAIWTNVSMSLGGIAAEGEPFAIAVVENITERKRLEIELRHAQKLESVGRLAAGVAHEINTPIQFIGDNVHFIGKAFETLRRATVNDCTAASEEWSEELAFLAEEVPLAVGQTLDGVSRVATIVRAMKGFGHSDGALPSPADINEAVNRTLVIARTELKDVADVRTDFAPVPPVVCYIGDISQVVLNLLVNAAHAIGQRVAGTAEKGCIQVATRVVGDGVEVAISDTGGGVAPELRERIFEPFFTTKEVGRGTGQGLSLARTIVVERHGGTLTLDENAGLGSTFRLWLPFAPSAAHPGIPPSV